MNNVKYTYSSVLIKPPKEICNQIIDWGKKNIADEIIYHDPDKPSYGREDEIHITALYGIHSSDSKSSRLLLKKVEPFEIKLGKINRFDGSGLFDVVMIEVQSPALHKLNRKIRDNIPHTNKFKVYKPHITIAYVKHGEGKQYIGEKPFAGESIKVDHVYFSSKVGKKEKISLQESIGSFKNFFSESICLN